MFLLMKKSLKHILYSIIATIVVIIICYVFDNIPYPFGANTVSLTFKESIARRANKPLSYYDSVVFINTGYDLELVKTENGMEAITNRDSLLKFLKDIQDFDYRYMFIDIRFEKGITTPSDSALVAQICSMRDIIVAKHWNYENQKDYELIDNSLLNKSAYCDYTYSLYNSSFSKYQYLQPNGNSAALEMYNKVNDGNIRVHKIGKIILWYSDIKRHWLCFNSLFLTISDRFIDQESSTDHSAKYLNLGSDIYGWYGLDGWYSLSDLRDYCKDKIICIGDFAFDLHDTYNGKQPGTYLHWLAYDSLCKGKHIINNWWLLVLFILYTSIFFCKSIRFDLAHFIKNRFWSFMVTLLGSSFILSVVCYISYWNNGPIISIFIPSAAFSLYNLIIQYREYDGYSKKSKNDTGSSDITVI